MIFKIKFYKELYNYLLPFNKQSYTFLSILPIILRISHNRMMILLKNVIVYAYVILYKELSCKIRNIICNILLSDIFSNMFIFKIY